MRNPFKKLDRGFFLIAFIVLLFLVGAVVLYILFHSDSVSDLVNRNESFSVLTVVHDGETGGIVFSNIMFYSPVTQRAGFLDIPKNAGELLPSLKRIDRIDAVYKPGNPGKYKEAVEHLINDEIEFSQGCARPDGTAFVPGGCAVRSARRDHALPDDGLILHTKGAGTAFYTFSGDTPGQQVSPFLLQILSIHPSISSTRLTYYVNCAIISTETHPFFTRMPRIACGCEVIP